MCNCIASALPGYGFLRALVFLTAFITVVIAIACAVDEPLYSAGKVEHPHTHAFDAYACPFPPASSVRLPEKAWEKLAGEAQLYELSAAAAVAVLLVLGVALRVWDPDSRVEQALAVTSSDAESTEVSWLNSTVPGPVLGVTAMLGLIAFSVVGCFVYYPAPDQTLEDMRYVKADALSYASSKNVEMASKSIQAYDDLTRKLQVGYYLRHWSLSDY